MQQTMINSLQYLRYQMVNLRQPPSDSISLSPPSSLQEEKDASLLQAIKAIDLANLPYPVSPSVIIRPILSFRDQPAKLHQINILLNHAFNEIVQQSQPDSATLQDLFLKTQYAKNTIYLFMLDNSNDRSPLNRGARPVLVNTKTVTDQPPRLSMAIDDRRYQPLRFEAPSAPLKPINRQPLLDLSFVGEEYK